mgnify:CR=1 FL=1
MAARNALVAHALKSTFGALLWNYKVVGRVAIAEGAADGHVDCNVHPVGGHGGGHVGGRAAVGDGAGSDLHSINVKL